MWIAAVGCLFVAPFSLNNLIRGRFLLGFGSLLIVAILVLLSWISYRGHYSDVALLLFPPVLWFISVAIEEQGIVGVMWTYPAVVSFYFVFREQWAWMANATTIVVVVPLSNAALETGVAMRAMVTLALVSGFSILAVRVIGTQQRRLEELAVTDPLTGLLNRSLLTPTLEQSLHRATRFDEATTLLAVDIDHFKNINDTYGHSIGDEVLTGISMLLKGRLRGTDRVFRTGGEEFTIVLSDTEAEPAHHVAQLLRSAIAGENLIDSHPVTVSVGVARIRKDDTPESWLARADRCLYEAKRQGRNRVDTDTPFAPAQVTHTPSVTDRFAHPAWPARS